LVGTTDYSMQGINAVIQRNEIFQDGGEEVRDSCFTLRNKLVENYNKKYV
jgi:hypothetical protein